MPLKANKWVDKSINKVREGGRGERRGRREGRRELETETRGGGESRDTLDIQITIKIMPKRFWLDFGKWNACKNYLYP